MIRNEQDLDALYFNFTYLEKFSKGNLFADVDIATFSLQPDTPLTIQYKSQQGQANFYLAPIILGGN